MHVLLLGRRRRELIALWRDAQQGTNRTQAGHAYATKVSGEVERVQR
jgi:hypothetical protein